MARTTSNEGAALVRAIRAELRRRRDPEKAAPMRAYMKSAMPFLGLQSREIRAACRNLFPAHPLNDSALWRVTVLTLWREARYREERYAAIELTGFRAYQSFQTMRTLGMYGELVVSGAWWDLVDPIATQRLGLLVRRYPRGMATQMRAWSRGRDLWKRRSSILCQIKSKGETDVALLYDCIRPSIEDREFFLRKAIGWALREYAKTDPDEVLRFVRSHERKLSGLSKREALKHVG